MEASTVLHYLSVLTGCGLCNVLFFCLAVFMPFSVLCLVIIRVDVGRRGEAAEGSLLLTTEPIAWYLNV